MHVTEKDEMFRSVYRFERIDICSAKSVFIQNEYDPILDQLLMVVGGRW